MRKTYLPLSDEDRDYLKALSKKRTIQAQVVDRARIPVSYTHLDVYKRQEEGRCDKK